MTSEEKKKDPMFLYQKARVEETYKIVEPLILNDEEILGYFRYTYLTGYTDDKNPQHEGILTYYKYDLAYYLSEVKKDSNKELNKAINEYAIKDMSNDKLNTMVFLYKTMAYVENDDLLLMIFKTLYLLRKYEGTPFYDELIEYYKNTLNYEKLKPTKKIEEITEENKEEAIKQIDYYKASIRYHKLRSAFYEHIKGFKYHKDELGKELEIYLVDKMYLWYYYIIYISDLKEGKDREDKLDYIRGTFKNCISEAEGYHELREELERELNLLSKKYDLSISLSEEELKEVKELKEKVLDEIGKYDHNDIDYINFNSIAYLLGLPKKIQEDLKDPNYNLSLEFINEDKKKLVKDLTPIEKLKERKAQKEAKDNCNIEQDNTDIAQVKKKITPNRASKEEIEEAYKKKIQEYYKTGSTPTNRVVLDTIGAFNSIEQGDLEKVKIRIKDLKEFSKGTLKLDDRKQIESELKVLEERQSQLEAKEKELIDTINEKETSLEEVKKEYQEKELAQELSLTEKEQYETLIKSLTTDLIDTQDELKEHQSKGVVFRGNLFNELEYTDERGKTIATLRKKNGDVLDPKEVPTLAEVFLRIANNLYYNKQDNYNDFIDRIDVLFPTDRSLFNRAINEAIKKNLGTTGFILDIRELLTLLNVSDENLTYYSKNIGKAIEFFDDLQISVQQEDKLTQDGSYLNAFFGLTSNVHVSRQIGNNVYVYFEISSIYETILSNNQRPFIAQNPIELLEFATGKEGNKRVFKLGDYLYMVLRESLNGTRGGVKIDKDGHYYKTIKVKSLLKPLRESGLIKEPRPRKYREDVFNKLTKALETLEERGLIKYSYLYDDTIRMSNDIFKSTFEASLVHITYLKVSDDYENILDKNLQNKGKARLTNANKFILTWGKYEGKTLKQVLEIDKAYLEWILSEPNLKIPKPKITKTHIKRLLDNENNKEQLKD